MSQQVQVLLEAEKESSKIIQKAKQYRVQKLKEARLEAAKEIEVLKKQKQQEFVDYESKFVSTNEKLLQEQESLTAAEMNKIKTEFQSNKQAVIDRLLGVVGDCKPLFTETKMIHKPVLIKEICELITKFTKPKILIDACYGGGGYSREFLRVFPECKVVGFDRDKSVVGLENERFRLRRDSFVKMDEFYKSFEDLDNVSGTTAADGSVSSESGRDIPKVDGIIFDLGISSIQLDDSARGFSFRNDGRLDMRMNLDDKLTAHQVINEYERDDLVKILGDGEEYRSWIVDEIIKKRPIDTTGQLAQIVEKAVGWSKKGIHPATKTFQAIRMHVNNEMDQLRQGLKVAMNLVKPNGFIAIVTFHSLEDRLVKKTFAGYVNPTLKPDKHKWSCIRKLAAKGITIEPEERVNTGFEMVGKVIMASDEEVEDNPRARSAKLRFYLKKG